MFMMFMSLIAIGFYDQKSPKNAANAHDLHWAWEAKSPPLAPAEAGWQRAEQEQKSKFRNV